MFDLEEFPRGKYPAFNGAFACSLTGYDDSKAGRIMKAFSWWFTMGERIELADPMENRIVEMLIADQQARANSAARKSLANSANGRKGGRPKREAPADEAPGLPTMPKRNKPKHGQAQADFDTDTF